MTEQTDLMTIFLDVYSDLPRYGPGSNERTLEALAFCSDLPETPRILDVGCGSGMQTIALAQATSGQVIAVDYHQQYLDEFALTLKQSSVSEQITLQQGDMNALLFGDHQFDLIWSEGAVYIMGVENALNNWKSFLKPDGYLVFSEIAWIKPDPPQTIFDFWHTAYEGMGTIADKLAIIKRADYDVVHHFTLPDADWWTHYYDHLEAKLPALTEKYADTPQADPVLEETRQELAYRRQYGAWFSYEFFVCQRL